MQLNAHVLYEHPTSWSAIERLQLVEVSRLPMLGALVNTRPIIACQKEPSHLMIRWKAMATDGAPLGAPRCPQASCGVAINRCMRGCALAVCAQLRCVYANNGLGRTSRCKRMQMHRQRSANVGVSTSACSHGMEWFAGGPARALKARSAIVCEGLQLNGLQ